MEENADKHEIEIICYCLMPNHFHLLLRQKENGKIPIFMKCLQLGYAKYFNTKYQRVGPLFQGRFKAKWIENDEYLLQVSSYIHRNPLSLNKKYEQRKDALLYYPYSSYKEYISTNKNITNPDFILSYFSKTNPKLTYRSYVEEILPKEMELAQYLLE